MSDSMIDKYRAQWTEMDPKFKWAIGAIGIAGTIFAFVRGEQYEQKKLERDAQKPSVAAPVAGTAAGNASDFTMTAMPRSNRNMGLEDVLAQLEKTRQDSKRSAELSESNAAALNKLTDRLQNIEATKSAAMQRASTGSADLNESLPPPVDFGQPGSPKRPAAGPAADILGGDLNNAAAPAGKVASTSMKVWPEKETTEADSEKSGPPLVIPVNAALESVMLTGINARTNSSGYGASGSVLSANNVGSPFVTRIKGNAILPNGWKLADLGDCFLSGTGIAILSTERANVIANMLSCIDKKGRVFEAPIKAYGVDLDGIQGLSGRLVTKQGAVVAKSFTAGLFSGLGSAVAPQGIQGYNSNQQSGQQQGIQYANPSLIAGTSLGSGIQNAAAQTSKFYMDYAKEMFPVVEVNAGTRVTWILQETVELKLGTKK